VRRDFFEDFSVSREGTAMESAGTSYNPRRARELAEQVGTSGGSDAEQKEACGAFEQYHSAARMLRLAEEVEVLRSVVEQAQRIRFSPDVGYVDVRHLFAALREMNAKAA
jgi:hypothetical protein